MRYLIYFSLFIFILQENASAMFQKRLAYRQDDNRPPFLDDSNSSGRFYIGGGFEWLGTSINDMRSAGMSENMNKALYNMESNYAKNNSKGPNFTNDGIGILSSGIISLGYVDLSREGATTRHELEVGFGSQTANLKHVSAANKFNDEYDSVKYTLSQKRAMYNFYITGDPRNNLNLFGGFGIGVSNVTMALSGAKTSSDTTGTEFYKSQARDGFAAVYSVFFGGTYDITDSIVAQAKLKIMVTDKANKKYANDLYAGSGKLMTSFGLEISVLYGL
ncbi:hypothetical protein [Candidatus Deianiraea vastatrix]|uniref:Uncharacterized protein n=1 Tax=Candidatus Deianiraea vastatrix TaxID=2163644 RepID=A0A5B8XHJ7_9RICK|nr:hypothetical protein [Candidatus Deianiraea vastatrix]QED23561.1 hypothetical protein Deia_00773 [Candidatus Deianiraea vastatrix]